MCVCVYYIRYHLPTEVITCRKSEKNPYGITNEKALYIVSKKDTKIKQGYIILYIQAFPHNYNTNIRAQPTHNRSIGIQKKKAIYPPTQETDHVLKSSPALLGLPAALMLPFIVLKSGSYTLA